MQHEVLREASRTYIADWDEVLDDCVNPDSVIKATREIFEWHQKPTNTYGDSLGKLDILTERALPNAASLICQCGIENDINLKGYLLSWAFFSTTNPTFKGSCKVFNEITRTLSKMFKENTIHSQLTIKEFAKIVKDIEHKNAEQIFDETKHGMKADALNHAIDLRKAPGKFERSKECNVCGKEKCLTER